MKKVVGKSLVLLALGVGAVFLLGGGSVFSKVLSNLKSTPTPKKDEKPLEEKEEIDQNGKEIALEASPQAQPVEEPKPEERVAQQVETRKEEVEIVRKPEPQRQVEEPKIETPKSEASKRKYIGPKDRWKKRDLGNNKVERTHWTGEIIHYENEKAVWSSWRGRLTETEEEKNWRETYDSRFNASGSGRDGTGIWCLTPSRDPYQIDKAENCGIR